jgi:hypothetical protein
MGPKGEFEKEIEMEIAERTLQAISSCANDRMGNYSGMCARVCVFVLVCVCVGVRACAVRVRKLNQHHKLAVGLKELQQLGGLDSLVKSLQLKSLLARRFALWALATCAGDSM